MVAHESEARPSFGTWFCSCRGCSLQLEALARFAPATPIVVKRGNGRTRVSAVEFVADGGDPGVYCSGAGDYVREVFVGQELGTVAR